MYCVCCRDLVPIQGQGHGAFELPTTSEGVHAGGDDRSPLAGLSGFTKCYLLSDFIIMQNFVAQSYVAYNLLICS